MYKILGIITLIAFLINGCSSKAPTPTWKHISVNDNQLKNPGFELVGEKRKPSFWSSEWTRTWSNGAHSGKQFLRHPWASGETTTKQLISLKKRGFNLADIDNGLYKVKFGGFQKGTSNENEKGEISVAFFDINQKFILTESIGKINAGIQWKKLEKIAKIPKNTRYIQYNFTVFKPKSTKRSKGPYVDDTYVYVFKGKNTEPKPVVISKVETKLTHIVTNEDISVVAYSQANKVIVKDLTTDKVIFENEYQCKDKAKFAYASPYIKDDILRITNACYKNNEYIYEYEFVALNEKLKNKNLNDLFNKIAPDFFMKSKKNKREIYDLKSKKLLYSFEFNSDNMDDIYHYVDTKSNKIVFYPFTIQPISALRSDDFINNDIYIFDMKTKKGKKISIAQKGKKYKSIFPVGFFVGTKKNGDKIFYQISAQSEALEKMAIAAKNDYKDIDNNLDGIHNLYPSLVSEKWDNKPVEIFYKGINLSNMKYDKLNNNYIFSDLNLNRNIQIKKLFEYLNELGGPTRSKNTEYRKLTFANSYRVDDNFAIDFIYQFSLIDLKTGKVAYKSKRKISPIGGDFYKEVVRYRHNNITTLVVDTKRKTIKTEKKLYSYQENRDLIHRFHSSADGKLLVDIIRKRIGRTKKFSTEVVLIDSTTAKVSNITLPKNIINSQFTIKKFTKNKILITNDKTYHVVNLKNKGEK